MKNVSTSLKNAVVRLVRDEEGASMAEYALLLGVITVALITVISLFRNEISTIFQTTTNSLSNATAS